MALRVGLEGVTCEPLLLLRGWRLPHLLRVLRAPQCGA